MCTLTRTEVSWLVMALNHEIAAVQDEIEQADGAHQNLIQALGRHMVETREALKTKLMDVEASKAKTIKIV